MGKTFREWNPRQILLLPPCVEDFIPRSHAAHFVNKLITEELDLRAIVGTYKEERGAPPFSPVMMTGILLYAYMIGECSSRRISRGCEERMDFAFLAALNRPDFRTISEFRKRHLRALGELFKQVVELCDEAGLVELKHVAIDGTKIKANAAIDQNRMYSDLIVEEDAIEKSINEWFSKAEQTDAEEDEKFGDSDRGDFIKNAEEALRLVRETKKRIEERDQKAREERKRAEEAKEKPKSGKKVRSAPKDNACENKTDPDSRIMKSRTGFVQGYNAQAAVDSKCHVIVSRHVSSEANDRNELKPALIGIISTCGRKPREVSADTDYASEENFKLLHKKKVRGYVSQDISRGPPLGKYSKVMLKRLKQGWKRTRYRLRKQVVEPVFGNIKAARGFRQFFLRGMLKVSTEWSLLCTGHNLLKLFKFRHA